VVTGSIVINGDNLNHIRCEATRNFRNKKRKCVKDNINELELNNRNKNTTDPYRVIHEFKGCYQLRDNLMKDDNGDLLAESHILYR
jgi:hypothetical protein